MQVRRNTWRSALHGTAGLLALAGAVAFAQEQPTPATNMITVTGMVLGQDGRPASGEVIGYKTAEEVRALAESRYRTPSPSSAATIAKMSEAEKQAAIDSLSKIMPGMLYVDGSPIGQTDASGTFFVRLPRPGTYIITATTKGLDESGSRQPIVVSAGEAIQLAQPIKLTQTAGRKPAEH